MKQNKETLKKHFETGDKPTQGQYADLIDSYIDSKQPEGEANRRFIIDETGEVAVIAGEKIPGYTLSDIVNNKLSLLKDGVAVKEVDLTSYIDDTNLARLVSGTVDGSGIATFTRDDNSTFTVDLSNLKENLTLQQVTDNGRITTNELIVSLPTEGYIGFTANSPNRKAFISPQSIDLLDEENKVLTTYKESSLKISTDGNLKAFILNYPSDSDIKNGSGYEIMNIPYKSGTIATLDDVPQVEAGTNITIDKTDPSRLVISATGGGTADVSNLVPYTGATQDVDLGDHYLKLGKERTVLNKGKHKDLLYIGNDSFLKQQTHAYNGTDYVPGESIGLGKNTLLNNTGTNVVAIGISAAQNNTGINVVANGNYAAQNNTGNYATAIGDHALRMNTGTGSVGIGSSSGEGNTGDNSVFVGVSSGNNNTGRYTTGIGYNAARSNTGNFTTAIGYTALAGNTHSGSTGIGYQSGTYNTGNLATFLGFRAGYQNKGNNSIAIGNKALSANTSTGHTPIAIGNYALEKNTGYDSVVVGSFSGNKNTGNRIVGLGNSTLSENKGSSVVAIGYTSARKNFGDYAIGVGDESIVNNTGNDIVGVGYQSLRYNSGEKNTALGVRSWNNFVEDITKSKSFTAAEVDFENNRITVTNHGFGATNSIVNLKLTTTGTVPTGLANGMIGSFKVIDVNTLEPVTQNIHTAGDGSHTFTPQFVYDNTTVIGYNSQPTKSNQVVLGSTATEEVTTARDYKSTGSGYGVILKTPDGAKDFRISIDNSGNVVTTEIV